MAPPDRPVVGHGFYGRREELVLLILGKTIGEIEDEALRGKLGGPDNVGADQVDLGRPDLKLGLKLVEVLTRVSGHLAVVGRVLAGVLLVEEIDGVLQVT